MNKIAYIFFDTPMYYSHAGLMKILSKSRVFKGLEDGMAIFINRKWTGLKLLTPENVILYLRRPDKQPIVPETIKYLPSCVSGGEINYERALEAVVKKNFENRFKK